MSKSYSSMRAAIRGYQDELKAFTNGLDRRVLGIIEEEAVNLKEDILAQVPLKSGNLAAHCYVHISRKPGAYGLLTGAKATDPRSGYNYAPEQHENTDYSHVETAVMSSGEGHKAEAVSVESDRGPFFISEPLEFSIENIVGEIDRAIKRGLLKRS